MVKYARRFTGRHRHALNTSCSEVNKNFAKKKKKKKKKKKAQTNENRRIYLTLWCFVVYSTRRFVVCLTLCHFVLVFFSPFSIAITSLGEERANLSAFRTFDRFVLVWICRFPLPLGVWEGPRFVIVALPGLFSYLFYYAAI